MADIQSNIQVNIDATEALAQLKALQRQLSLFNTSLSKSTGATAKAQADLQQNLINSINATGKFNASLKNIKSSAESFTESLEKNKFSTREYFRFAAGSTKAFSKIFKTEFDTIGKVAEERVKTMQTQYIKMGRDANGALKSIAVRPLTLDMKELGTQVALTSQKQQLFGQLLKQGSTNLLNFGKNTQWAGRQLMVGFTIPLTIFGSKASQVFMDLEKQAIRFKRVYGEMFTTQAETQKALDQVRLLADEFTKYGIAVADTMKMAADAAAQGKIGADLMAQVAQATRLSVLGQVEQQQALETTMSLQNAFGYSAEQLASKINFLNAVENQTVVGIEDLTIAIPKAGPVVQQLGGSVEDLAFFLTAMKEGGINASEGANALKSGLASLINPTDKAAGMLADLGINIEGIVKRNKGNVSGIVTEFAFALDRLTDLDRAKAIEQLFGKFQFARLSTLFQNVIKDGNQASRVLDLMGNSTEELAILSERELKTLENATGTKFKKSMENLKASIAPVGEQFLKAVTPIAEFLTKVLDKFNSLGEGGKKALVLLATIFGAIGPVFLMTFGLIANGAANIIKLFGTMRNGFLGLGKQSDRLAFQTQYMSSEQIEAATIAASLDQAHAKLIQTFTQEAGAVGALTAAYQKGMVAANNFAINNPGSMMPRKKFAKGGIVPGSGNTDSVPAMLTPGEFVVNKKATRENRGFLQGLNKGGFVLRRKGTPPVPGMVSGGALQTSSLHLFSRGMSSMHTTGPLAGRKKYAGYTLLGSQAYNNQTESKPELPSPYPLTREDAKLAIQLLSQVKPQTPGVVNALGAVVADWNTLKTPSMWENAMAERYALNGVMANGGRKGDATYQSLRTLFLQKSAGGNKSTSLIAKGLAEGASSLWSQGILTDRGMGIRSGSASSNATHLKFKKSISSQLSAMLAGNQTDGGALSNLVVVDSKGNIVRMSSQQEKFMQRRMPGVQFKGFRRFANGGSVPGYGEKDTVPALLTPGEFVVNKKATQQNGPILEAMNSGGLAKRKFGTPVQRYQQGGFVNDPNDPFADVGVPIDSGSAQKAGKTIGQGILSVGKRLGQIAASSIVPTAAVRQDIQDEYIESEIQRKRLNASIPSIGAQMAPKADVRQMTMAEFKAQNAPQTRGRFMSRGRRFGGSADNAAALQQRDRNMMARVNGASFALMGLTNAASMMGDGIADKVAPVTTALSGLTMAMSMIQGPKSGIAVAIGAVAGTYYYLKKQNEALLAKTIETTAAMGAGEQAMRKLAETTGKVSAGEVMDRRRSQKLSQFQIQPGKKTFGQAFVEGETGQQMIKDFGQSIKDIGQQGAQSQLVTQLATAITSGIMTPGQARSVAANIGEQLGNRSFGINVNAQLLDLIGAEGENLLKDPVSVRVKLIEDSKAGIARSIDATKNATRFTGGTIGRTAGFGLAGGAGGALAGLVAGGTVAAGMAAAGATVGSAVPVIGTAIGAVAGLAIGAMIGLKKRNEAIAKATGASVAMQKIALEQSQELLDSYDVENQKKIQQLETEGKLTEAAKLRSQYEEGRTKLLAQNATLNDQILNSFKNAPGGKVQHLMLKGAEKAAVAKYKDTPMAPIAEAAVGSIQSMGLNREQQYLLNVQMSSGQLDPAQVMNFASLFQGDKEGASAVLNITTKFGGTTLNELTSVTSLFVDRTGKPLDSVQKQMFVNVNKAKTPEEAQKLIDFYNNIGKTGQVLDLDIVGNYVVSNPVGAELLQDTIAKIQAQKGKIDMKVTTKLLGASPASLEALNSNLEYYNKLPDEQKKVYLTVLATATETFDLNSQDAQNFMKETGMQVGNARRPGRFIEGVTAKDVSTSMGTRAAVQATKVSADETKVVEDGTDGGGSRKPTLFDDLLKRLKLVQDSSINATGGLKELKRVMLGKGAISLTKFEGIDQKLLKNGKVSKEFLDFVDSLGPEGLQKDLKQFITIGKKGIATLNEAGKALMRGMAAKKLGEIDSANKNRVAEIKNEITATSRLIKAGFTFAEAQEMAKDATVALAIANGELDDTQLQKLRKSTQKLTKAQQDYEKIQKTAMMDEMDGQKTRFEMVQKYIALQEKLIENQYAQQKATLESKQDANNYALDVISRQEEKVNKEYDKQVEYLDQIQARQEQINQLQQQRLGLAQALSQGDMAGAAQAIQSIRQEEVAAQIEARKKAIEKSRQEALGKISYGGRNRQQIEDDNKQISNSLTDIAEKIRLAKESLDKQLQSTIGMTRVQIDAAVTGIAAALDAGVDPNSKDFLGNILKGVMGDATATKTALENTTTEIETLIAKLNKAKAQVGTGSFTDQQIKAEADAKAAAQANAKLPENLKTIGGGGAIVVGGNIIPINSSLTKKPSTSKSTIDKLKQMGLMFNYGGMVPKYFASGGYSRGTDTIPAMLTPGEYVVRKSAVDALGVNAMNSINSGKLPVNSNSVYNYGISVNVNNSNANPNDIARTVINQIKQIDAQRIRSYR
jgi:TP901 family phage tail tape measure protein